MAALKLIAVMYAVLLLSAVVMIVQCGKAEADHSVYLPLVPNTPMIQNIIATQEVLWCVNDRGVAYPNFVSQLQDVNDQYAQRTGIKHRQVAWGTPATTGCQEQHNMVWGLQCGGCAAHVFFANWPVVIEYKEDLLHIDRRSAAGHEITHDRLGLNEMYKDSGGTIQCTGRQDTVMDCGSGVRYPQALDVSRGAQVITTPWYGRAPDAAPACGLGEPNEFGHRWDSCAAWWDVGAGASPRYFKPDQGCGEWYLPDGRLEWGACDPSWGARWQAILDCWISERVAYCNGQHGRIYPIP